MSWCRNMGKTTGRFAAAGMVLFFVAGCGFSPLYGDRDGSQLAANLRLVEVAPIDHALGVGMRNRIRDNIARHEVNGVARYTLAIRLSTDNIPLITERDSLISRFDYALTATYQLLLKSDGAILHQSSARIISSYNILEGAEFDSLVAEQSAAKQAAREISREIVTDVSLYFDKAANR